MFIYSINLAQNSIVHTFTILGNVFNNFNSKKIEVYNNSFSKLIAFKFRHYFDSRGDSILSLSDCCEILSYPINIGVVMKLKFNSGMWVHIIFLTGVNRLFFLRSSQTFCFVGDGFLLLSICYCRIFWITEFRSASSP